MGVLRLKGGDGMELLRDELAVRVTGRVRRPADSNLKINLEEMGTWRVTEAWSDVSAGCELLARYPSERSAATRGSTPVCSGAGHLFDPPDGFGGGGADAGLLELPPYVVDSGRGRVEHIGLVEAVVA